MQTDDGSRADRVCKEEKARVWRPESQSSQSQQSLSSDAVQCGRAGLAACALLVPALALVPFLSCALVALGVPVYRWRYFWGGRRRGGGGVAGGGEGTEGPNFGTFFSFPFPFFALGWWMVVVWEPGTATTGERRRRRLATVRRRTFLNGDCLAQPRWGWGGGATGGGRWEGRESGLKWEVLRTEKL